MPNGNVQSLAERIAGILESESRGSDLSSIQASLENINIRLEKLESESKHNGPTSRSLLNLHPSTEKFSVIEAMADEIIANLAKEKACTFEPNGKPCDHCSMCSSRGF